MTRGAKVSHGGWLFGPRHQGMPPMRIAEAADAVDFTALKHTYRRITINALLHKLEAFGEPPKVSWVRGMENAVWKALEQCRGEVVPTLRLRQAIRPCGLDRARTSEPGTLRTLHVAICWCRRDHPDERIVNLFGEGYMLERRA